MTCTRGSVRCCCSQAVETIGPGSLGVCAETVDAVLTDNATVVAKANNGCIVAPSSVNRSLLDGAGWEEGSTRDRERQATGARQNFSKAAVNSPAIASASRFSIDVRSSM